MSVELDSFCYGCHYRRNVATARSLGDEATATAFARELMQLYLDTPVAGSASPLLSPGTTALFQKYYGLDADRFRQEKADSNKFVLERLPGIRRRIETTQDPLFTALQFAILGNYIDFSALQGELTFEKLDEMLKNAENMDLDRETYHRFREKLGKSQKLLYLTDNAGEIGFDRLLGEEIARAYPNLAITFCVRGGPAANDATRLSLATRADAALMELPFPVIDNGTNIPGTVLSALGAQAKQAMDAADVILSKGQGNVETLYGCGYPIFYAFLVKCQRFQDLFGKEKLTPMFVEETGTGA